MIDMKWFGRSKNKEKEDSDTKRPAKLKKDDKTVTETTTKPSTQKIETENELKKMVLTMK